MMGPMGEMHASTGKRPRAGAKRAGLALAEIGGAVLAGGRSTRFGTDKARAPVGGRPMVVRVLESLEGTRERCVVRVAGVGEPLPPLPPGVSEIHDLLPGGGPLSGLHAALSSARGPWLALAACDLPCLSPAFWQLLCDHVGDAPAVSVVHAGGRLEPLAALYRLDALGVVEARLRAGDLALQPLLAALHATPVPAELVLEACGSAVLRNVNRPGDVPDPAHPCGPGPGPA